MRSPKADMKNDSERWVANWLEDLKTTFEYEREMGGPRPDFMVPRVGDPEVAIEVEDLSLSKEDARKRRQKIEEALRTGTGWCEGHDPYPAVRKKIEKGRKQLKGCRSMPCLLVLYDTTGTHCLDDSWVMFGAMLGGPAIQMQVGYRDGQGNLIAEPGPSRNIWGDGGKVVTHGKLQNTSISAIGVLSWKPVLLHRYGRTDDYKEPCMDLYLNPFARLRWPDKYVGVYDRVHEWSLETGLITITKDGLSSLVESSRNNTDSEFKHILQEVDSYRAINE